MINNYKHKVDKMNNNLIIFPLLKKSKKTKIKKEKDIDEIVEHYQTQLFHNLKNHDIQIDSVFEKDFIIQTDILKAVLYRSMGLYHPLQELLDKVEVKLK